MLRLSSARMRCLELALFATLLNLILSFSVVKHTSCKVTPNSFISPFRSSSPLRHHPEQTHQYRIVFCSLWSILPPARREVFLHLCLTEKSNWTLVTECWTSTSSTSRTCSSAVERSGLLSPPPETFVLELRLLLTDSTSLLNLLGKG